MNVLLISHEEYFIGEQEYFIFEEQTETYMISSQKNKDKEERKYVYNDRIVDGPELVDENAPNIRRKTEEAIKSLEKCGFPAMGFCLQLPGDQKRENHNR